MSDIFLASQSPRRRELLTQIGISFDVLTLDIDESINNNEMPEEYVLRMAKEKALAGRDASQTNPKPVLGSDTVVVVDGEILGKPEDHADARRMLRLLSGRTHQVMTAVALTSCLSSETEFKSMPELNSSVSVSSVSFKKLSDDEIERYINSGECDDKAGGYGIQGQAATFITNLSGSYSGVMGLPLYETSELLNKAGISADSLVVS